MTKTFKDLYVWKKAYDFTLKVYKVSRTFPPEEKYGFCSQFQRAAVSITANIAEGYRKLSKADKLRFFNISQGSLEECRCYVHLGKDLGYYSEETFNELYSLLEEISKLLISYCQGIINNNYKNNE